jgi:hypothetical protein
MEGPNSLRIKEQETCLTLQEHDDDDEAGNSILSVFGEKMTLIAGYF